MNSERQEDARRDIPSGSLEGFSEEAAPSAGEWETRWREPAAYVGSKRWVIGEDRSPQVGGSARG